MTLNQIHLIIMNVISYDIVVSKCPKEMATEQKVLH